MFKFNQVDFHLHTMETPSINNKIPVKGLIREAEEQGLKAIAITDHWKENTNPDIFLKEKEIIDQNKSSLKVYLSSEIEMRIAKGEKVSSPINCKKHKEILDSMDFVGATFHLGEFVPENNMLDLPKNLNKFLEYIQRKLMNLIKNESYDLIFHGTSYGLTDCVRFGFSEYPSFEYVPESWLDEIAGAAAYYDTGLELTEWSVERIKEHDFFIKKLIDAGVKLTVGSDFHYYENRIEKKEEKAPGDTKKAVELIKKCGGHDNMLWLPSLLL